MESANAHLQHRGFAESGAIQSIFMVDLLNLMA
jgi:hypothetical protein